MNQLEHDLFISYSTIDNQRGWVAAFVRHLEIELNSELGKKNQQRIWWDEAKIDKNLPLTTQIRDRVSRSRLLVVLLSPGYCESDWCRQEREAFLSRFPNAFNEGRLILIDLGKLGKADRPEEFRELRGHDFFTPNEAEPNCGELFGFPVPDLNDHAHRRFFNAVNDLARKLKTQLKATGAPTLDQSAIPHPGIRIFLAQATDDVADERDEVARYLADHFTVAPPLDDPPIGSLDEWNRRLDQALQTADVYVQLVGSLPGRKLFGSDHRPVLGQFARARQAGKTMFLWRKTDPEEVAEPALREVLNAAEYVHTIQEFREAIVRRVTPLPPVVASKPTASPTPADARSVFIQAGVEDADQADQLSDLLAGCNCFAQRPLLTGTPEEIRADLEENLDSCDGVIVLYGKIPPAWLKAQFRELPRHFSRRKKKAVPRPIPALAVYEGEPPNKPDPGVNAPGLQWIETGDPQWREKLRDWVTGMAEGGAS